MENNLNFGRLSRVFRNFDIAHFWTWTILPPAHSFKHPQFREVVSGIPLEGISSNVAVDPVVFLLS